MPELREAPDTWAVIVLVEGASDRVALEVVARRLGLQPPQIIAIGGAHAARRARAEVALRFPGEPIMGLVDIADRWAFERELSTVHICDRDLEDELIRALGTDGVLGVIEGQGQLESFQRLQRQPALRERALVDQLRRFFGGRSGNKERYAELLAAELDLQRIPRPFLGVLGLTSGSR